MSTAGPDDEPHADEPQREPTAGPRVGNVLGFSLLFRERRALLAVAQRSLAAGVRLRDYEAVIPGVRFPLRGPLDATTFRNRRCRVVGAHLSVEERAVRPWLERRLVDAEIAGMRVRGLELDLRRDLPDSVGPPRPCLMLSGESVHHGGPLWLLVAFDIEPVHRLLVLRPCRQWLVGELGAAAESNGIGALGPSTDEHGRDTSARRLWRAIARRIAAGPVGGVASSLRATPDGDLIVDIGRLATTRPFASVGWKAPNFEGCAVESLTTTRRAITVGLRGPLTQAEPGEVHDDERSTPEFDPVASDAAREAVSSPPDELGVLDEPIARDLDRARELVRSGDDLGEGATLGLELLTDLSEQLAGFPAARLALVRWRVQLARFLDREACLEAVREWMDLQPSAIEARRLLMVLLAAEGRSQELAQLLSAQSRQPHPPVAQARLELAVASLLIDRLDDPRSALTIVGPLIQRIRDELSSARDRRRPRAGGLRKGDEAPADATALAELMPDALVILARARVAEVAREGRSLTTAPHVLEALDEALATTDNARRRADLRAQLADAFAEYGERHGDPHGGDVQALALLRAAIVDAPEDGELLDRTIDLALRAEERAMATDLLALRLRLEDRPGERASLRKRLIAVASELDDREHQEVARRELTIALDEEPTNVALLRRAASLERKLGQAATAAEFIGRLLELDAAGDTHLDDREHLILDRARLLERCGRIDAAWESLRPALARIPAGEVTLELDLDEAEIPWILDILELGLDLAPPTDRPRMLDLLITYARGQRRGEALVERAAQALRIDERLHDLWLALDELDDPSKVLAQIEQLLDDRDHHGLERLAAIAEQRGEAATELHARARLGHALVAIGELEAGCDALARAVVLDPERLDLRRDLVELYERLDRPQAAIPELRVLFDAAADDAPEVRAHLCLRLADRLRDVGESQVAAELVVVCSRELAERDDGAPAVDLEVLDRVNEAAYRALRERGEDEEALQIAHALATRLSAHPDGRRDAAARARLGGWLSRAAQVLADDPQLAAALPETDARDDDGAAPRSRLALLERAAALRPDDLDLAERLEVALREHGDDDGLERHLRRQMDHHGDPELQVAVLERMIAVVERDPDRRAELGELLEDLLALQPTHVTAMLRLGELRFARGERAEARQLWTVAADRVEPDDPRFYRPALELGRDALETGELDAALELTDRAHRLRPDAAAPLVSLTAIARARQEPARVAETLARRVARVEGADVSDPDEPLGLGQLVLALATAIADWHAAEPDPQRAADALDHFARAERLYPASERDQDRSGSTRRWLALALEIGDREHEARARAVLRETLGDELSTDDVLDEIALLTDALDRPLAALERLEWALPRREADPRLVDALERLLDRHAGPELSQRAQRALRVAVRELAPSRGRTRLAELLVAIGRELDDPASVAFALDQIAAREPERVEIGEYADLREWAVRKLDRVPEEIGALESRLAGSLSPARRDALTTRLLGLLDDDRVATARRLLELCNQADREGAAALADAALELLEPVADSPAAIEHALEALRLLARHGQDERLSTRWSAVEGAVRQRGALGPIAELVELGSGAAVEAVAERADALLREWLPSRPQSPELMAALWRRASADVLVREGAQARTAIVAHAVQWIEATVRAERLEGIDAARLFDALAGRIEAEIDVDAAARVLRERAQAHAEDPALFDALFAALARRGRSGELLELVAASADSDGPDPWLRVAAIAADNDDRDTEIRARVHAGERLARAAALPLVDLSDPAARSGSDGAQLDDAQLGGAQPDGAQPDGAQLDGAQLDGAQLDGAQLDGAQLDGAQLDGTRLDRAQLDGTQLDRAPIDEPLARRAVAQLRAALELDPERAALRWRLGLALAHLGDARAAFDELSILWRRQQWSAAGVERGQLALRTGALAAEIGEHARAVELLTAARERAPEGHRERATEHLFSALLEVDRRDDAIHLASARAAELGEPRAAIAWLQRALALASGQRRLELLRRAHERAPADEALRRELEAELESLGEASELEALLRERVERCRRASPGEAALTEGARITWVASLEALIAHLERPREDAEPLPSVAAEVVALSEELLRVQPDHVEALLRVADQRWHSNRYALALLLWERAESGLADDDPRLFAIASRLAERAIERGQPAEAHRLLERALALRPNDAAVLSRRHEAACALDDPERVRAAASDLLERTGDLDPERRAELESDVSRAHTLLGQPRLALEAIARAARAAPEGSELHRSLAERWLALLDDAPTRAGDGDGGPRAGERETDVDERRRELEALSEARRATGLRGNERRSLRELGLLIDLRELEAAHELLEALMVADPESDTLRGRLRELAELEATSARTANAVGGERVLRTLRRVVDAIEAGPPRDALARELAEASRRAEAPRTALDALERLSGEAAATPEMLDLRVWAVRKLDRVEDELGRLDSELARAGGSRGDPDGDEDLLHRLLQVFEHDAEACARRLIELAQAEAERDGERAAPAEEAAQHRAWLLESALTLVLEYGPARSVARLDLGVVALTDLLELLRTGELTKGSGTTEIAVAGRAHRRWRELSRAALEHAARDRRALATVVTLVELGDRIGRAGDELLAEFSELARFTLERALVEFPDHAALHTTAQRLDPDGPGPDSDSDSDSSSDASPDSGAIARIEALARAHALDAPARARLYLGLAATFDDSARARLLAKLGLRYASEPAIFGPLREALRTMSAFDELVEILDHAGASAEQWMDLADDAAAARHRKAELEARRRAGLALYARAIADDRGGATSSDPTLSTDALADDPLALACEQLARARAIQPKNLRVRHALGLALERAGEIGEALEILQPLIDHPNRPPEIAQGPLARRCGLLALELGQPRAAVELLTRAYARLAHPRERLEVADRLFEVLDQLAPPEEGEPSGPWIDHANSLALRAAELSIASADQTGALTWLERAARLTIDETERARLLERAHAMAPDDQRLADAYETSLRALDDHGRLEPLLRARVAERLGAGDREQALAVLDRLLDALPRPDLAADGDDEREAVRDRAELLEQYLRLEPETMARRLELARLRLFEGDREAAASHWRALAPRLADDDPRFLEPARQLATFALEAGDLERAKTWLERARVIDPDDIDALGRLLDVGHRLERPHLVLATSEALLRHFERDPDRREVGGRDRATLQLERALAFEQLGQPQRALSEARGAAEAAARGSSAHVEASEQWLRLAADRPDASDPAIAGAMAQTEAEARAELRAALGDRLPARAYLDEAQLLVEIDRGDDAIELLLAGLRRHPGEADLLAELEDRCASAGEQARFVASLAGLVRDLGDPSEDSSESPNADRDRARLGEKLARSARAIGDAEACLTALGSLPTAVAERADLLELRDWAVRALGGVDDELARLDDQLLALGPAPDSERLQAVITRMLRLLGEAGEPCAHRLLDLARRARADVDTPASVLARAGLRIAREYAPERLDVALDALGMTLEFQPMDAVAPFWAGVEALALERGQIDALVELLRLATVAEQRGDGAYGARVDRLASAAARIDPGAPSLHAELLRRVELTADEPEAILDRLFDTLEALRDATQLAGPAIARLWTGAAAALDERAAGSDPERRVDGAGPRLRERLRREAERASEDPETFAALVDLLRARGERGTVLDLLLWVGQRQGRLDLATLNALADEASEAGDASTRERARLLVGERQLAAREYSEAAAAFSDALAAGNDEQARPDLRYRLGDALARAGRPDAALEHLLPLVEVAEPESLVGTIDALAEQLGLDAARAAPALRLDAIGLTWRCGALLAEVEQRERAIELLGRAFELAAPGDARRPEIAEQLLALRVQAGDREAAANLASAVADESHEHPRRRITWLLRVAEHAEGGQRAAALEAAVALDPEDHALARRYEAEIESSADGDRLRSLLRERIDRDLALAAGGQIEARERAVAALRKLIDLLPEGPERAPVLEQLLAVEPDDVDAILAVAAIRHASGDLAEAVAAWRRTGDLLAHDDERFFAPALSLAEDARADGRHADALALLERALEIQPGDLGVLERLRQLAVSSGDLQLHLQTIDALLEQPERASPEHQGTLLLEAARAHAALAQRELGPIDGHEQAETGDDGEGLGDVQPSGALSSEHVATAIRTFEQAAAAATPRSPLHRQIAATWLGLVRTDIDPMQVIPSEDPARRDARLLAFEREVVARAQVRAAAREPIPAADLRLEASLLAIGLGRVDDGLTLIEGALMHVPDDALLLSAFKDLCLATGTQERYANALDAAIAAMPDADSDQRDRLATELAFTAVELEDAPRLLAQLDRMTPKRANSPELLDLREWAIRKLGKVEDEMSEIDRELLAVASDDEAELLVARLLRMLEQDVLAAGQRLAMLSSRADPEPASRLREAALELARRAEPNYFDITLGVIEQGLSVEGTPQRAIAEHWPAIEKLGLERDDPGLLALLIELGQRAAARGLETLRGRVEELRDMALTRNPASPELHALVLGPLERELEGLDREARLTRADEALAELADRLGLDVTVPGLSHRPGGRKRALLWVGFSQLLDRREGAALLTHRARQEWADDRVFQTLVDALEDNRHWTRALELLELRVARDDDEVRRVGDLKHLAHLCADILGDPDAAIGHLERALEIAPEDPDLLLPLLDHYYAMPQLDRAIELSARVLDHVPMGPVAFAALGHRATDAALATGEHEVAEALLRKILERVPNEPRTQDRLRELEQLAGDPEHKVRMLAAIANRTAGSARVEALEERARLLITPLGRLEEAIADLEAVLEESPARPEATSVLADLYEQRQRWSALVELLGREYPRQRGLERVLTLQRMATIQRDRLDDLPGAEAALHLALENVDGLSDARLIEQLGEQPQLLDSLAARVPVPTPDAPSPEADDDELAARRASLDYARRAASRLADRLHLDLVDVLERSGRFSELIAMLEAELTPELHGQADARSNELRLAMLQRLAGALRTHVDDGERTAKVYVVLEQFDALPEEGLAALARWYRSQQRYDDLVRILTVRSRKLAQLGDFERKSEADFRIGELLEGPLRRPHEAARFFLDAYLANPFDNPAAGVRARVLLAGTDSVVNVRNRLLMRLPDLPDAYKPALLTLLADLLSPHDDHELEAERRYREALARAPELASALEGLGRLLSRQGRLEDAIAPLRAAAISPDLSDARAADDAALAARALIELDRTGEAETVLGQALNRAPNAQRALLELAGLYERLDRGDEQAQVLGRLARLPLSSTLRAEVGYRQAMLLADEFRRDPMSEAGERGRALLLEAVGADAMHARARQTLLELATARSEWSIVAHMHFLAIRDLPLGPRRALTQLDLAETYLDRLSDVQSAVRNLAAALQQAPVDVVVVNRSHLLLARLPDPAEAATRMEQLAAGNSRTELDRQLVALDEAGRARLLLTASDLHLRADALKPAEAAARAAVAIAEGDALPAELRKQAEHQLEQILRIDESEFDLRKRRKQLVHELAATDNPLARLELIGRLRENARALGDDRELERLTGRQLELAHELLDSDHPGAREPALAVIRDVFAGSGDYARVVSLYEDLAARTGDSREAAELLSSAARFAWSGLRDPRLAVAIVRRALDRAPTHAPATELLGEIAGASDEPEVDATICDELSQLAPRQRPPLLTLRLAEAALRLDRREQAQGVLRQLLAGEAPIELRLQALNLLDGLLDGAGRTHDRIPLLEERLELCRRHWPDRAADLALDLALAQRTVGNLVDARATCRTALLDKPSDQPLAKLYAELLEQSEDWLALARALEQLANLTIETNEQAHWLTRAAQVHLDRNSDGRDSLAAARRLLERARAVSTSSTEARAVLLPLTFHQGDWERVLDLAIELRSIAGDAHEALVFAALTEAFARGKRTLARSIGDRHDRDVRQRILWPCTARLLDVIAHDGPLPRLDAVLSAAGALCGGTEELLDELGAWAAGQPLQAGLALGLARINEAFRRMEIARHLYQLASFMAPNGPVPMLTTRLPPAELPAEPLQREGWIPLEWRGALREVLLLLRAQLAGLRGGEGHSRSARTPKERLASQHASRLIGPWRNQLGVNYAIAVTEEALPGGLGVRNLLQPTVVVNERFVDISEAERRYRVAHAAAALATGLGLAFDSAPIAVTDLLDGLTALVQPRHEPTTEAARGLLDTLAARGLTAAQLNADLRRALARELEHWRGAPEKLERVLARACALLATRLSGTLEGALIAAARDAGLLDSTQRPEDAAILETPDAGWLLRALGVLGGYPEGPR